MIPFRRIPAAPNEAKWHTPDARCTNREQTWYANPGKGDYFITFTKADNQSRITGTGLLTWPDP
ncbi:hypothetical protein [Actinomadura nitritigenes]|uniref:hypothetical protein n=1 Tax=Actinomadura nitritigenes TaxID=134602 RepID=UPI003D8BA6A4